MTDEQIFDLASRYASHESEDPYVTFHKPHLLNFARALLASSVTDKQERTDFPEGDYDPDWIRASRIATPSDKQETVAQVDEGDDGLFVEILYGPNGSPLKRGDKLYAAPPATPSDKQEAIYQECINENGLWMDTSKQTYDDIVAGKLSSKGVRIVYAAPPAQSAEQDRIDAERSSQIAKELRKLERYPTSFNQTERSVVLKLAADQLDKGASK
jgi:hypothetical protein